MKSEMEESQCLKKPEWRSNSTNSHCFYKEFQIK